MTLISEYGKISNEFVAYFEHHRFGGRMSKTFLNFKILPGQTGKIFPVKKQI